MNKYLTTIFNDAQIRQGQTISYNWEQIVSGIRSNHSGNISKYYSPFVYRCSFRSKDNSIQAGFLVLDNPEQEQWQEYTYFCYPSEMRNTRMIVPLIKPVSIKEYQELQAHIPGLAMPDTLYPLAMSCSHQDRLNEGDRLFNWENLLFPDPVSYTPSLDEYKDNDMSDDIEKLEFMFQSKYTLSKEDLENETPSNDKLNKALEWLKSLGKNPIRLSYIYCYAPRGLNMRRREAALTVMNALESNNKIRHEQHGRSYFWYLPA